MGELQTRMAKLHSRSGTKTSTVQQPPCDDTQESSAHLRGSISPSPDSNEPSDSASDLIAPSPDMQEPEIVGERLPGTSLKYFSQIVPPVSLDERFRDLRTLFSPELSNALTKKRQNASETGLKLRYLGTTAQSAEPYMFVQCPKKSAKIVKKFFAQEHISEELRPYFRLHILEIGLKLLVNDGIFQVFANQDALKTWCGVPITMSCSTGQTATATFGGVIMVEDAESIQTCYGLTASHALNRLRTTGLPTPDPSESSESDISVSEAESNEEVTYVSIHETAKPGGNPVEETSIHSFTLVGSVKHHTLNTSGQGNFDWALIALAQVEVLPNVLVGTHEPGSQIESKDSKESSQDESNTRDTPLTWDESVENRENTSTPVFVVTRRGQQSATLTLNSSSTLIAPGQQLVETHDLMMSRSAGGKTFQYAIAYEDLQVHRTATRGLWSMGSEEGHRPSLRLYCLCRLLW